MTEVRKDLDTLPKDSVFRFTKADGAVMSTAFIKKQKLLFAEEVLKNLQEHLAIGQIYELANGGVDCQFMGNGVSDWTQAKIVINVQVVIDQDPPVGEVYKSEFD